MRNPVAQTALGPMVLAAVEQHESPGRRLVNDDLAAAFLPPPARWLTAATRSALPRRLFITAMERAGPDGTNLYGTPTLYRITRQRRQLWHFGLPPGEVAGFLAGYGWRLVEQVGPEQIVHRYVAPTGRNLTASQIEWSADAEKT